MSRRWSRRIARGSPYFAILILAIAALAIRSIGLEHRPVHGDEANQAYKAGRLLDTGRYVYDPHDHHGPTLYYSALIPFFFTGTNSLPDADTWMLRSVPVVFSAGTIALLALLRREMGTGGAICAGLLLLASPAFTFYSRYYIQESLLVFFTFCAIVCGLRYVRSPGAGWAVGFGLSLSLMHATKETAVLAYAAMGAAGFALWLAHRSRGADTSPMARPNWAHVGIGAAVALAATVSLYSAFFTHGRGPLDSVLTYANYFDRASASHIHDKPWHYYLSLLWYTKRAPGPWWSEGHVLLLGAAGAAMSIFPRGFQPEGQGPDRSFVRFLTLYTLLLGSIYSIIPYKTPWSMLSFYFGIVLLAGIAVARGAAFAPAGWRRMPIVLAFAVVLGHLGLQSWRAETVYAADVRNPYVYAHTSTALVRFVEQLEGIAASAPEGRNLSVKLIQPDADYWPLPWYLRRYPNVRFAHAVPDRVDAQVVIVDPRLIEAVSGKLDGEYFGPNTAGLRPGVLRAVYVKSERWDAYMSSKNNPDEPVPRDTK